jgi:drug/metabolite transporter, DME family
VLGLRWIGRGAGRGGGDDPGDAITTVVAGNMLACLIALPMAIPVPAPHLADAIVIVYLGAVQIGLAYLMMSTAMPHVPALEASTILLVEPALNPLWAWLVHGERPAALSIAGGAVIILSAAGKAWWDARRQDRRGAATVRAARG